MILLAILVWKIQEVAADPQKDIHYSFLWGLFKSKDFPKEETIVFEFEQPKMDTSFSMPLDTSKYEEKSLLGGAIKWTVRKKNSNQKNKNDD